MLSFKQDGNLKVVRGQLLNPLSDTACSYYQDGLIVAKESSGDWLIEEIGEAATIAGKRGWDLADIAPVSGSILPPFYDTHFHWVQDEVRDMPKTSLLEWLEAYTFPEEARFADPDYAEAKAKSFWSNIMATGTVGGLCFSSVHQTALDAAMKYAPEGFHIGSSLMTTNCPESLRQSEAEAIEAIRYGTDAFGKRFVVSPRFAPTTPPSVMREGARVAEQNQLFTQTHLCETRAEIEWVLSLYRSQDGFTDVDSYTEIYHRCQTLGPRTVMAHAIYLDDPELELLANTGTCIASCPTSNAPLEQRGLGSGLFNFEQAESYGIPWSLASDIGGGPYLSLFDVMASFVEQNRTAGNPEATFCKALYRCTQAAAEIMRVGDTRGNFLPGKRLDYIVCECPTPNDSATSAEELISSICSQVDDRSKFDELPLFTVLNGQTVFERAMA